MAARAQHDHHHDHAKAELLGRVHFPTSCKPAVQPTFDRAVALLYSFGYDEARRGFESVAAQDTACGMAHWGVAMTYYHPIWAAPTPAEFAAGRAAAGTAAKIGGPTDRERRYIEAIGAFYQEDGRDHGTRANAYRMAMEKLTTEFPSDDEAQVFFALSLLGTAPANDRAFAQQKRAAGILNRLLPKYPEHPGILHYIIHSFDVPQLATLALPAARAYAKVAPASPHALHMPSHIFTRLGLWDECITSNIDSAAAAKALVAKTHPGAVSFDALHALDYLVYAYLQTGVDEKARSAVDEVVAATKFDEPNFAAAYAKVAAPARYALERRDWTAATALQLPGGLPWERFAYARGITYFANALGASRTGDVAKARTAVSELGALHAALVKQPPPGPYDWAGQVESMRLAAAGWVAFAEGRKDEAVGQLTAAAEKEEAVGKHPVTPGAVLPARELLGDLLLEMKRPQDALTAYERSLAEAPRRFNSLAGAVRAAELAGDSARAKRYSEELIALCGASCKRSEAERARSVLAAR
jgi:tetratricopeptide (TPR) repeat protein